MMISLVTSSGTSHLCLIGSSIPQCLALGTLAWLVTLPAAEYNRVMARRKNPYAVALGRRGAKVRYHRMTPAQRRALARKAARARWAKHRK
jgi:hypothetical protein